MNKLENKILEHFINTIESMTSKKCSIKVSDLRKIAESNSSDEYYVLESIINRVCRNIENNYNISVVCTHNNIVLLRNLNSITATELKSK